jgi:hypothetical protein
MHLRNPLRRGLLALALGMTIATAAIAGDETTIRVRTAAGPIEKVTIQDIATLAVGESRALTTEAGNYALVRREADDYVLEVAGERFELADFASLDGEHADFAAHHGDGKHVVIRRQHGGKHDGASEDGKRVVIHKEHVEKDAVAGDGDHETHHVVRIVEGEGDGELALRDGVSFDEMPLDGDKRIAVMRRITKDETAQ